MKKFKVAVSRKVIESAVLEIITTSPNKAKAIAEYQANDFSRVFDWEIEKPTEPVRISSKVISVDGIVK